MDPRRLFLRRASRDSSYFDESSGNGASSSRTDRNELHFQAQDVWSPPAQLSATNSWPSQNGGYVVPYTYNGTQRPPPRLPERRGTTSSVSGVTRIARKPVGRSSISEGSALRPASGISSVAGARDSQMLLRSNSSTRDLFAQASSSLNHLAGGARTLSIADSGTQLPPPYSEPPSSPVQDVKRSRESRARESRASSMIVKEDDIFQLIQDNRIDAIQKMVEAGVGVEEVDAATGRTALMEAANLRRAYVLL